MAGALRMVSLARGHDPRDFALFAFGGAGPLHAVALARELALPKRTSSRRGPVSPTRFGCLVADLRHDYVNTINTAVRDLDMTRVKTILESQIADGKATIAREGVEVETVEVMHSADMQFLGQSHILTVPVPGPNVSRATLQEAFEAAYWNRFEVELPEIRAVLVNLHTAVIGRRRPVSLTALAETGEPDPAPVATRRVWFESGAVDTPIYRRRQIAPGSSLTGPAIIEQLDTTTVVEPGNAVAADDQGNLIITVEGGTP